MKLFSEWSTEINEAKAIPMRPKKEKHAAVAHADIDRWLKSVDGLARDLKDLQAAKTKAKNKMSQIGQKYKPDDNVKSSEKEKDDDKSGIERKATKRPRPETDRKVPFREPEPKLDRPRKPEPRPEPDPDIEDGPKPSERKQKPRLASVKLKKQDIPDEDVE